MFFWSLLSKTHRDRPGVFFCSRLSKIHSSMVSCLLFWPHLLKTTVDETMFVFLVSLKNQWRLTRCLFLWSSLSNLYLSSTFTNWTEGTPMFWVESSNNYTLNTCWFFGSRLAKQDISSIMSELLSGISKTNDIDLHVWSISLIS